MGAVILGALLFGAVLILVVFATTCRHKWKETSRYDLEKGREKVRVILYHCEKCGNPKEVRTKQ